LEFEYLSDHPYEASPSYLSSIDADHCFSYDTTEVQVNNLTASCCKNISICWEINC